MKNGVKKENAKINTYTRVYSLNSRFFVIIYYVLKSRFKNLFSESGILFDRNQFKKNFE